MLHRRELLLFRGAVLGAATQPPLKAELTHVQNRLSRRRTGHGQPSTVGRSSVSGESLGGSSSRVLVRVFEAYTEFKARAAGGTSSEPCSAGQAVMIDAQACAQCTEIGRAGNAPRSRLHRSVWACLRVAIPGGARVHKTSSALVYSSSGTSSSGRIHDQLLSFTERPSGSGGVNLSIQYRCPCTDSSRTARGVAPSQREPSLLNKRDRGTETAVAKSAPPERVRRMPSMKQGANFGRDCAIGAPAVGRLIEQDGSR